MLTFKDYLSQEGYKENYYQDSDENSYIYKLWEKSRQDIFEWILEESSFESTASLPNLDMPSQVILSGLLIMADWIASSEEFFPLIEVQAGYIPQKLVERHGYDKWKEHETWSAKEVNDIEEVYKKRFGFTAREFQKNFSEIINVIKDPGIIILESHMGSGKTEAGLIGVEQLAFKNGCNGMYFGLPTQATSNGMFSRIVNWLENVESETPVSLRLSHSKAYLNETFNALSDWAKENSNDDNSIMISQWFSGRKTALLDEFVVGTVDQFLMIALKQKHLALRHLGISKKVILIDEVHAYDAYMNQFLQQALKWMAAYNIPVILLSATLPTKTREMLVKHYMAGKGVKANKVKLSDSSSYPIMTYSDGYEVKQYDDFDTPTNKIIEVKKLQENELISLINRLIDRDGGIVGIVVNTVSRAQKIGHKLAKAFGAEFVEILHSGFIATERIKKEEELIKTIGKNGSRPKKKIVIGTQVIEQSLDIDFDVLISDLAPMDLLLQRSGRLHRHENKRNINMSSPILYIMGCSETLDFDKGFSAVYGDYLLHRTQYFIPDKINIPMDIPILVQKVYGSDKIAAERHLEKKIMEFKAEHDRRVKRKKEKAKIYRLGDPIIKKGKKDVSLIGWIKNTIPDDSEERAYAQVRDTFETVEVIALKKVDSGYTLIGMYDDISQEIDNSAVAKEIAKNTLVLPREFTVEYKIDKTLEILEKYNNKCLNEWRDTKWLHGALGIIFEEDNVDRNKYTFSIDGKSIVYDKKYGVYVEKEGG